MKAVCGYSQMQVLNASTVVLTSPLVFRYMLTLSVPNLVCSFPLCFVPSASPLLFPILPSGVSSCLYVSASLKHHALLCSSLGKSRGMLFWCTLESSAESSGCRTPAQCPLQIICKAGTPYMCTQMFSSLFPHEDSGQYASISDGEMSPKRHLDSLCQSRRDRFSF